MGRVRPKELARTPVFGDQELRDLWAALDTGGRLAMANVLSAAHPHVVPDRAAPHGSGAASSLEISHLNRDDYRLRIQQGEGSDRYIHCVAADERRPRADAGMDAPRSAADGEDLNGRAGVRSDISKRLLARTITE